jgi:hypothetical protein
MIPTAPVEPKRSRLVVNDTTYQALGVILENNPAGVLVIGDELSGLLQSLDTAGQEAARGFWLSGWSGTQGYSFDRIGRGTIILPRYCISVFGGFQPDRIKGYVRQAQSGSSGNDGLLQQFQLLVWPDPLSSIKLVDRLPDKEAMNRYNHAVLRLRNLSQSDLPSARVNSHQSLLLHFEKDAQELHDRWCLKNEMLIASGKLDASRQSHFAKYRSMVPALALIFHLLDEHLGPVCQDCLIKAIKFSAVLKKHADRIYASAAGYDHASTRTLAGHLLEGHLPDGFTCRELVIKGWAGLGDSTRAQAAIDTLLDYNWLFAETVRGPHRTSVRYYLNPLATADLL